MKLFNLHGYDWDRTEDREGWCSKDAWVGKEWRVVVRGEPTLRTPDGERDLAEGDVVCFLRGTEGAHQVSNRTAAPIRVLMLSTMIAPDVVEYLDSGKVGARGAKGEPIMFGRPGPMLEHWDGED